VVRGYVKALLAQELARAGRTADARAAYERVFEFWKQADPDLPILIDARDTFAKLGS